MRALPPIEEALCARLAAIEAKLEIQNKAFSHMIQAQQALSAAINLAKTMRSASKTPPKNARRAKRST